jgi:hypothetical protein
LQPTDLAGMAPGLIPYATHSENRNLVSTCTFSSPVRRGVKLPHFWPGNRKFYITLTRAQRSVLIPLAALPFSASAQQAASIKKCPKAEACLLRLNKHNSYNYTDGQGIRSQQHYRRTAHLTPLLTHTLALFAFFLFAINHVRPPRLCCSCSILCVLPAASFALSHSFTLNPVAVAASAAPVPVPVRGDGLVGRSTCLGSYLTKIVIVVQEVARAPEPDPEPACRMYACI